MKFLKVKMGNREVSVEEVPQAYRRQKPPDRNH